MTSSNEFSNDDDRLISRKKRWILGIKILISDYAAYVQYMVRFKKYGLVIAKSKTDGWYYEKPGDRPFMWSSTNIAALSETDGIHTRDLFIGRLRISLAVQRAR